MSPLKACTRHGAPNCQRCKPKRRGYSDTAAYRAVRAEVLAEHGLVCVLYCRQPIDPHTPQGEPGELVLAHVVSHADGGTFTADNLRPAHRGCNARAGR
jgi:5-methylcytosine-specific restriction endonuclease McrA